MDAHVADVTDDPPWARTVVGNLTAALIGNMTEIAAPEGPVTMLVSGVISLYADVPAAVFAAQGFTERERRELDGWAAIILERSHDSRCALACFGGTRPGSLSRRHDLRRL